MLSNIYSFSRMFLNHSYSHMINYFTDKNNNKTETIRMNNINK